MAEAKSLVVSNEEDVHEKLVVVGTELECSVWVASYVKKYPSKKYGTAWYQIALYTKDSNDSLKDIHVYKVFRNKSLK